MFERFTDRARRVVTLAQDESKLLNHDYIGTEHLLLGMLAEGEGIAGKALADMGLTLASVREQVERAVGRGKQRPLAHIPFTPGAKNVLELALTQALLLHHNYIGTEHLLLGLLKHEEDLGSGDTAVLNVDSNSLRVRILGYILAVDLRSRSKDLRSSPAIQHDIDVAQVALAQLQAELHIVREQEIG